MSRCSLAANLQPSNHVEEADAGRETRRRGTCGCKMKTNEEFAVDQSPIALGSSASHSPGTHKAQSSNLDLTGTRRPVARGMNETTASSSQVWHSDVNQNTSTEKLGHQ